MKRKVFAILGFLFLIFSLELTSAMAETLDISITTDKKSYPNDEIITMTIKVKNNSRLIAKNLRIDNYIPSGLSYVDAAAENCVIPELQPGAVAKHTIQMRMGLPAVPATGDKAHPLVWMIMLIGSICIFALLRKRHCYDLFHMR